MAKKNIAIGTWAVLFNQEKPMPFAELMKLLGELKFNGFELGGFDIHPKAGPAFEVGGWFADSNWVCEELKDLWASHNLECYGFAPDLWKHSFVAKPNPDRKSVV